MKKLLSVLLAILLVASIVTGCSSKSTETEISNNEGNEKVKIKVMVMSEDSNRQALYQDYYSKGIGDAFPDYDVEFELPGSEDNYNSKLMVYNASETLPDVFWGRDIVYQSGNALELTDIIRENGFYDKFSNKAALIPAPDGEIYCLSSGTDSYFAGPLFYNKDIFEKEGLKEPKSYEEFLSIVKTLKSKGYIPISATSWAIDNFLISDLIGADDYTNMIDLENKNIKFDNPAVIEGARKLKELADAGAFPADVTSIEQQVHEQLFIDGKAAMIYHPIWVYPSIQVADFEIGFTYLPEVFGQPLVNAWGSATGGGFMVSKNSKHQEAAIEIAQWLAMQDADYWLNKAGNVTAIKGFDQIPKDSPDVNKYFYNKMLDSTTIVAPNFATNFMTQAQQAEFSTNIEMLLTGQSTAEDFGKAMADIYK